MSGWTFQQVSVSQLIAKLAVLWIPLLVLPFIERTLLGAKTYYFLYVGLGLVFVAVLCAARKRKGSGSLAHMGQDRTREIYRALVYELLNWRDAQRELKALIKARYRGWGVLRLHGIKVFSSKVREEYLEQLPAEEERRMMRRLYGQFDHALLQWKETLKEVERLGKKFWEVREFERIPGVGPIAAHVFSAIIEEPSRFRTKHQLWKYSQLGITDRTSDGKPLGYQRLDRRGNAELKNLSYHAWRTACKSTTGPNPIKTFYQHSRLRTGSVRHARLNTQRKILETMWMMWLRQQPFDPQRFAQIELTPGVETASRTTRVN
jgi:transposase